MRKRVCETRKKYLFSSLKSVVTHGQQRVLLTLEFHLVKSFHHYLQKSYFNCNERTEIHVGKQGLTTREISDGHYIPNTILSREIAVLDWCSTGDIWNIYKGWKMIWGKTCVHKKE